MPQMWHRAFFIAKKANNIVFCPLKALNLQKQTWRLITFH